MFIGYTKFKDVPEIGFAHHYYTEEQYSYYYENEKSIEIVYIDSGSLEIELYGKKAYISEGSIFVLFRHLPMIVKTFGSGPHAHCTVQAKFDFDLTLLPEQESPPTSGGLFLPFIVKPCRETGQIKKELYSIVSDIAISRDTSSFSAAIGFLGIMKQLDGIYRKNRDIKSESASILSYRIKQYVLGHIGCNISLSDVAEAIKKTPNYLNFAFKAANGITITQYINREKVRTIAELMQNRGLSFKTACENAGITDVSYGYRLFKKHTGVTPREYLAARVLHDSTSFY